MPYLNYLAEGKWSQEILPCYCYIVHHVSERKTELSSITYCMGTVESRPEPLIDHLRQALSQLWEHRWRQFTCDWKGWSLAPFKGWLPLRKDLFLEIALHGVSCEPTMPVSTFIYLIIFSNVVILLSLTSLYTYWSYNTTSVFLLTLQQLYVALDHLRSNSF